MTRSFPMRKNQTKTCLLLNVKEKQNDDQSNAFPLLVDELFECNS